MLGNDGLGTFVIPYLVTPTGLEQPEIFHGKASELPSVPMPVPTSETIPGSVAELIMLWESLDETARCKLLNLARELAVFR